MGYPADTSVHKVFRNDINHVYTFFEGYHKDHWRIFNVAQEISYKHTKLGGNVEVVGFEDHSPPPFLLMIHIIDQIHKWMNADPLNVVAVHCKAGKGRTGTIISAYLISVLKIDAYDIFSTSPDTLTSTIQFFNSRRSDNAECVTVPSQKRYIGYYLTYLLGLVDHKSLVSPPLYRIANIEFVNLPTNTVHLTSIEIHQKYNPNVRSLPLIIHKKNTMFVSNDKYARFEPHNLVVESDVMLRFNQQDSTQCIFRLFFHTAFVTKPTYESNNYTTLLFTKDILDGPSHGILDDNRIKDDFFLKIHMELVQSSPSSVSSLIKSPAFTTSPIPPYQSLVKSTSSDSERPFSRPGTLGFNIPIDAPPPVPDRSKKPILSTLSTSTTTTTTTTSTTPYHHRHFSK
eukprot:gene4213-4908_t